MEPSFEFVKAFIVLWKVQSNQMTIGFSDDDFVMFAVPRVPVRVPSDAPILT